MKWYTGGAALFALTLLLGCGGGNEAVVDDAKDTAVEEPGKLRDPGDANAKDPAAADPASAGEMAQYITNETVAVVVINPQKLFQAKMLEGLPVNETVEEQAMLPLDHKKIKRIRIYASVGNAPAGEPPNGVVEMTFSEEVDLEGFLPPVEPKMFNGRPLYEPEPGMIVYLPDDLTMIIANGAQERKLVEGKATGKGPIAAELSGLKPDHAFSAVISIDPVREMLKQMADQFGNEIPEDYQSYLTLADTLKSARISFDLEASPMLATGLRGVDKDASAKIKTQANSGIAAVKQLYAGFRQMTMAEVPEEMKDVAKMIDQAVNGIQVADLDGEVTIEMKAPEGFDKLAEILGPAIAKAQEAAKRSQKMNNVKQIVLAFHNYESAHRGLPLAATMSEDGKPLLSWRVALLPYIEESFLYDEFDQKKAWDSTENKALGSEEVPIYGEGGKSRFLVFTGLGTIFDGEKKGFFSIKDGTSNTILVVQVPAEKAVPWAKPADIKFDPENPLAGLGPIPDEGLVVGMADGSVRVLPKTIKPETFKALVTANGGEPIDWTELE